MCRQDHSIIPHKSICRSSSVVKMCLMMRDKFFIPNLMHYLRSFIKGCYICQLSRSDKPPTRELQPQIYLNYRPLSKLSMDLKVMPRSQKGHKFILCIIDKWQITWSQSLFIIKVRGSRWSTNGTHYIKILCSWLYYHGSR